WPDGEVPARTLSGGRNTRRPASRRWPLSGCSATTTCSGSSS
ncbi:MAG: hypothetical protein AVDCRST_MAG05-2980, partial [uncultured Rubrobacteraceae bacterium]